jgi:cyanophycin synthetase
MKIGDITIRNIRVLRGPNLYAHFPVLQATLEIGEYEDRPSDEFDGFVQRLCTWLPGLEEHECSVGRKSGFIERLNRGTYLPHIVEHVCLELQTLMGFNVSFGRARGTGERGVYNVVVAYKEEQPAREAFYSAVRVVLAGMNSESIDMTAEIERLRNIADEHKLGPSAGAIVSAARRRGIPITRLAERRGLVQLGYGVYQKRIAASETSGTSAIAVDICQEKPLTNRLLRSVGIPVPEGRNVESADEAWKAAEEIGLPVVVKPDACNQGKGVSVNLTSEADIRRAFEIASQFGDVLVERFVLGEDHRLLIVDGKLVAASRRDPAMVIGDGKHTIAELIEITNQDPRRRAGHSSSMTRITVDDACSLVLQCQKLNLSSIPKAGQKVKLRTNCNLSTGGTATDVTDQVHPSNARVAELAAQFLGLDVAGIDILCADISRPLAEQAGAIVEVNAAPGLRMHIDPAVGTPRDVGIPIVEMLYPKDAPSRIPIIAVTGTNGKTTVSRLIAHMYETAKWCVGLTLTEGTYINSERILSGDCAGPRSAQAVLLHPHVEVAVLETARGGILREGLAFDYCSVGVVTNVSEDHIGMGGVNTVEDLARVKQVVIESVHRTGSAILNADDPLVAEMAAATDAKVVYFSTNPQNPVIISHLSEGESAIILEDGNIVLAHGSSRVDLVELERVSFTYSGKIRFQVQNALAAVAAAWSAGLNPAMIVRALTTFKSDTATVPGRFNVQDIHGVEVIFDYGHNPAAIAAMMDAVSTMGNKRTVMVIGLPGDRRDKDIKASISATKGVVDAYVLHDLSDRRERPINEVPEVMREAIEPGTPAFIAEDQMKGIDIAWRQLRVGDRLIVIADEVDKTVEHLQSLGRPGRSDGALGEEFESEFERAFEKVRPRLSGTQVNAGGNIEEMTPLHPGRNGSGWGYSRRAG